MKVRLVVATAILALSLLHAGAARADMPRWVRGDFELNGFVNVVMGFQRFSNDPITAVADDGSYQGPIGQWLPGATVTGAPKPTPGSDYFQFMIPKFELDVKKYFGKRAWLRADIQMGRPQSGSSCGLFNIDHVYAVVRLNEKYNVQLWLGRLALQAGWEPYQDYYSDTVSFSQLWRTIYPPATTTGAQVSADFGDHWSVFVSVGNGVINDSLLGRGTMPSWVTSIIYSWGEEASRSNLVITGWWGPESGGNSPYSYGADVTSSVYIAPKWLLGLEADWQRDDGATGPTTDYVAGFFNLQWDFAERWWGVLRYTYGRQFNIGNGVINKTGAEQQIHENTVALGYYIADAAKLKWEARVDVIVPAGGATQLVGGTALALSYAF